MFKTATLAIAAIAASATIASADISNINNFAMSQERDSIVELGTVTASGDGVVEVYSYHTGVQGELLGSEEVNFGANSDVRISIPHPLVDAIAVLTVDGVVVDTQELNFK